MKKALLLLAFVACKKELPASPTVTVVPATAVTEKQEGECDDHVGAELKGEPKVTLTDLFTSPEKYDQKTVQTEGTVRQVCQKAGCWMEIANEVEKGPGARITFKDYAFFMPKNAKGNKVKIEGSVKLAELSEERAKHYASEGATIARGPDGKAREIQIVASGVDIKKAPAQ
jgi:hypothetical protein